MCVVHTCVKTVREVAKTGMIRREGEGFELLVNFRNWLLIAFGYS